MIKMTKDSTYRRVCAVGGVCGWPVCGWLAAHTSVRPHTPGLVCLARFSNATPKLTHPPTRISIILNLKRSFRLDTSL